MSENWKHNGNGNMIAIENIELDTQYSITINPSDDYQYWNDLDRIKSFKHWIEKNLLPLFMGEIHGNIEVSPRGRLHIHGTLKWKSLTYVKLFYVTQIHKILDRVHVDIDTIKDEGVWDEYCTKQSKYSFGRIDYTPNVMVEQSKNGKIKYKTFEEL